MVLSCSRFLALAATAVTTFGATSYAAELTTFDVKYDAFVVTSEVQVEALASAVAAIKNTQADIDFEAFRNAYWADAASGSLTVDGHNQRITDFLRTVDTLFPNFSTTAEAAIAAAKVDFFRFQGSPGSYPATWDVLYHGAQAAQSQLANPTVGELLQTVNTYMTENMMTNGTSADATILQGQCDSFFQQADTLSPGFRDATYNTITQIYDSLWPEGAGSDTNDTKAPDAGDGSEGGSTDGSDDDAAHSSASSPPSDTVKQDDDTGGVPSPSPRSRATAQVPASSITMVAIALAYTALLL